MHHFRYILTLLLLVLGGCFDNHNTPDNKPFLAQANTSIAHLQQLCKDECYTITSDMVCVGRVTSSDYEGNFYRSMVIEDETGGVEIKLGIYSIDKQYPIGLMVAIHLKGTAIISDNGVVQVGLPPQSFDNAPREFEAQEVIDRHITRSNSIEAIAPLLCDIASLDTSLCGRFVRIEGLRHSPLPDKEEKNYYRFTDNNSNEVYLHISSYADFADMEIPSSDTSIQGILYHEAVGLGVDRQYVIKPRFADDISTISSIM